MVAQLAALGACVAVVLLARWGHSYIAYGHGMESLWDATKRGGDASSPLRTVDFRNLVGAAGLCFLLVLLSLAFLRRPLLWFAALASLLVVGQAMRFVLGLGPQWGGMHHVGATFWISLAAAVVVAVGALVAASRMRPREGWQR